MAMLLYLRFMFSVKKVGRNSSLLCWGILLALNKQFIEVKKFQSICQVNLHIPRYMFRNEAQLDFQAVVRIREKDSHDTIAKKDQDLALL